MPAQTLEQKRQKYRLLPKTFLFADGFEAWSGTTLTGWTGQLLYGDMAGFTYGSQASRVSEGSKGGYISAGFSSSFPAQAYRIFRTFDLTEVRSILVDLWTGAQNGVNGGRAAVFVDATEVWASQSASVTDLNRVIDVSAFGGFRTVEFRVSVPAAGSTRFAEVFFDNLRLVRERPLLSSWSA